MTKLKLFCDASVDPQSAIGYGACLLIGSEPPNPADLSAQIRLQRFEQTNAARLELQTLIWALKTFIAAGTELCIHSDSQTLCELPQRQQRLIANNFCSAQGRPLNNADLYREFYQLSASYQLHFCKQRGHLPSTERSRDDQIFRLVDKAARAALRQELKKLNSTDQPL